jgi:hypothetical protein
MEIPSGVRQAVIATWATIAVDAVLAVYCKLAGIYSEGMFMWAMLAYSLICIIPYKMSVRSNSVRYVYVIFTAIGVLMTVAGVDHMKPIELYISLILTPVEVFIIYRLFQKEASDWFTAKYAI